MKTIALIIFTFISANALASNSYYRCVVFDPTIEAERADQKIAVIQQEPGANQAKYISKNVVLDFDFKASPMHVVAKTSNLGLDVDFSKTVETTNKYHGYIAEHEIEINCRKKTR